MTQPVTIVMIEDDEGHARLIEKNFRRAGVHNEVVLLTDGASAISRLTRSPLPDVLVTDLHMPHVDGVAVTHYARSREPRLPVFIVTGHPNLAIGLDSLLEPLPVVFTKPLDYRRFAEALHKSTARLVR